MEPDPSMLEVEEVMAAIGEEGYEISRQQLALVRSPEDMARFPVFDPEAANREMPTTVRMTAAERVAVKHVAALENKSFSQALRELVQEALAARQQAREVGPGPVELQEMAQTLTRIATRLAPPVDPPKQGRKARV